MYSILLATMAAFGVSALITNYDGPFNLFIKLRSKLPVFVCCVCLSVWVAIPIALYMNLGLIGYLAMIGAVILLERLT